MSDSNRKPKPLSRREFYSWLIRQWALLYILPSLLAFSIAMIELDRKFEREERERAERFKAQMEKGIENGNVTEVELRLLGLSDEETQAYVTLQNKRLQQKEPE